MKKFFKVVFKALKNRIINSLKTFEWIIIFLFIPASFFVLGYCTFDIRIKVVLCALSLILLIVVRSLITYKNMSFDFPVPAERFTKDEGDGEITIEYARLQEMIIYVFDIEEYLTSIKMMKK